MSDSQEVKIGVSKYKNIMGITCYMNSILHILQQIPIFSTFIAQAEFKYIIANKYNNDNEILTKFIQESVITQLFKLFQASLSKDDATIIPTSFKQIIGTKNDIWNEFNQQDSQEFFTFLISQLEEEIGMKYEFVPGTKVGDNTISFNDSINIITANNAWNKFQLKEFSILKEMFDGLFETIKKCSYCNTKFLRYEPFLTLSISIPIQDNIDKEFDIYECLDHLIMEEQLNDENKMTCDMCGLKNKGFSKSLLWKTPQILVLHIKRFLINSFGIPAQKLNNNILYPITLDLEKYFNQVSPFKKQAKYNLIGINLHQALGNRRNINCGHYTSIVKNHLNNNWYLYDDSEPIQQIGNDNLQNPNAYMLFYYRND
jgi:ubiquitin C-terminal hydrolase